MRSKVAFGLGEGVKLEYAVVRFLARRARCTDEAQQGRARHKALCRSPFRDGVGARVAVNQWLGDQTHIATDFAGGTMVLVEHDRTNLSIGENVGIRLDPASLHVFDTESGKAICAWTGAGLMRDILIGIDAGTSVIKSVAFDLGGRQIAVFGDPEQL